jgi:hypothetical protein
MMDNEAAAKALFDAMPHAHPEGHMPDWEIQPESIKDAFRRKAAAASATGVQLMADDKQSKTEIQTPQLTGLTLSPAPVYYASGVNVTLVGNDFFIGFTAPRQGFGPAIPEGQAAFMFEPVVSIALSVRALKDVVLAATERLEAYEKEFGKVVTDFSRRTEGKK